MYVDTVLPGNPLTLKVKRSATQDAPGSPIRCSKCDKAIVLIFIECRKIGKPWLYQENIMRGLIFLLLLIIPLLPVTGQDTVYRWKDAQGSTHYGAEPPAGVQAEPINLNAKPVTVTTGEQVYTWKDDEGNIHYGDHAPADREAAVVDMETKNLSTIRATEFRSGERDLLRQLEGNR